MRKPPSIREWTSVPVTSAVWIASLAAMLGTLSGGDMERFVMDTRAFHGEPWRILTSTLLHGDWVHLVFNLFWLWVFGGLLEKTLGSLRTLAIFLFLAVTSALAEWTFSQGGIGLSGVGYGLFGMLLVLSRIDPRFENAIDRSTVVLFVAWFFFCIVATLTDLMAIGNVAHGAGWAAGSLLGLTLARSRAGRAAAWISAPLLLALLTLGATWGRPLLNFAADAGQDSAWLGYRALQEDKNREAAGWYKEAVELNPQKPGWWYNLGVTHSRLAAASADEEERRILVRSAYRCYLRAQAIDPDSPDYRQAVEDTRSFMLSQGYDEPAR